MTTKTVTIQRDNGARVKVDVLDTAHYEVVLFYDHEDEAEMYWREEYVAASTAAEAKRIARKACVDGEKVESARKISLGEAAVFTLHGAQVIAEKEQR